MTIEENIEAALFARVATLAGSPPIAYPNRAFPTPGSTKPATYIEVRNLRNVNDRRFVKGTDPHFRQGILQLDVLTPLNAGSDPSNALAGAVAAHFPADTDLYSEGIRVRIQAAPDLSSSHKTDDGVSWSTSVSVRYEAFA